jgi:hypothetical protein
MTDGWTSVPATQPRVCHGCGEPLKITGLRALWFDTVPPLRSWHTDCYRLSSRAAASQTPAVTSGTTATTRSTSSPPVTGAHWRAPAKPCALEPYSSVTETEAELAEPFPRPNGIAFPWLTAHPAATASALL